MNSWESFGIKDIIDVVCVALLLFYFYKVMKRSSSLNMFIGIMLFFMAWIVVSQVLKMELMGAVMDKLIDVGVLALIILFADDIRHFFRDIGTHARSHSFAKWFFKRNDGRSGSREVWQPLVRACVNMGKNRQGALIVLGDEVELRDIMSTGETLNAELNQLLIENIFFKNSPLHDGAMILIGSRIKAAGCILPVSQDERLPKSFGLRHRAAKGITEACNVLAIVVSEETGRITVFKKDGWVNHVSAEVLEEILVTKESV